MELRLLKKVRALDNALLITLTQLDLLSLAADVVMPLLEKLVREMAPHSPLAAKPIKISADVSLPERIAVEVYTMRLTPWNLRLELAIPRDMELALTIPLPTIGSFVPLDSLVALEMEFKAVVKPDKLAVLECAPILQQ